MEIEKEGNGTRQFFRLLRPDRLAVGMVRVLTGLGSRWKNIYRYDVKTDYRYDLPPHSANVTEAHVRILSDHFQWPEIPGRWDTGFLRIKVRSNLLGSVLEPFVDIEMGDSVIRQTFERGAAGIRFLNISPMLANNVSPGKIVRLRSHHISWDSQDGCLFLFRNPNPENSRILVIAPHPDDAEIAAFGLYSHKDTYIITATAGEVGVVDYSRLLAGLEEISSSLLKGKLRVLDSITIPMIGGIKPPRMMNFGYFDDTLKEMYEFPEKDIPSRCSREYDTHVFRQHNLEHPPNGPWRKNNWKNLVEDLTFALKKIQPDMIVAPHPALDSHPDHQYLFFALIDALERAVLKGGNLFLYTIHSHLSRFYPYGPSNSIVTLPPCLEGMELKGVYSYALTKKDQMMKTFALEAMHDVRSPPPTPEFRFTELMARLVQVISSYLRSVGGVDAGYYRRNVRPNELFFVYPYEDGHAIKTEYFKPQSTDEQAGSSSSQSVENPIPKVQNPGSTV